MKYYIPRGRVTLEIHDKFKYEDREMSDIKEIQYTGVESFEVISGEAAAKIEAESDGSCIDDLHEYLVLTFKNGETSTYRNSYVDLFLF